MASTHGAERQTDGWEQILDAASAAGRSLSLPVESNLFASDFARVGDDLVIETADGGRILISDYFGTAHPPDLVDEAGAVMPSDLVMLLAGPEAPGQYADAGGAVEPIAIGRVEEAAGTVIATRADGTQIQLDIGAPVFAGDVIEVGAGGGVTIVFADESTFSLGENSRIVLDSLIFDPMTLEGESLISVLEGVFVFVGGEIAINNPDDMVIRTPAATIGIRADAEIGGSAGGGHGDTVVLLASAETGDESSPVWVQAAAAPDGARVALSSSSDAVFASGMPGRAIDRFTITAEQTDALFGQIRTALPELTIESLAPDAAPHDLASGHDAASAAHDAMVVADQPEREPARAPPPETAPADAIVESDQRVSGDPARTEAPSVEDMLRQFEMDAPTGDLPIRGEMFGLEGAIGETFPRLVAPGETGDGDGDAIASDDAAPDPGADAREAGYSTLSAPQAGEVIAEQPVAPLS